MDPDDRAYFHRRARQEREHALRASRPETRIIHAELADRYEAMVGGGGQADGSGTANVWLSDTAYRVPGR